MCLLSPYPIFLCNLDDKPHAIRVHVSYCLKYCAGDAENFRNVVKEAFCDRIWDTLIDNQNK